MNNQIRELSKRNGRRRLLKRGLSLMCAFVLLFTMNTLKRSASTLERIPMCGLEEHAHAETCYDEAGELICGLEAHSHTDACYQQQPAEQDAAPDEAEADVAEQAVEEEPEIDLLEATGIELTGEETAAEEALAEAMENEAEGDARAYVLGETALLSQIIEALELEVDIRRIAMVGAVEDEEARVGLLRVEALEDDWQISAQQDFDEAELALVLEDDILVVTLANGKAPAPAEEAEQPEQTDQPEQPEQPEAQETASQGEETAAGEEPAEEPLPAGEIQAEEITEIEEIKEVEEVIEAETEEVKEAKEGKESEEETTPEATEGPEEVQETVEPVETQEPKETAAPERSENSKDTGNTEEAETPEEPEETTEPEETAEPEETIEPEKTEETGEGERAEEPEAVPTPAIAYPEQTFEAATDFVKVSVSAPEGAFPEGTTMAVRDVEDEQTLSDIEQTVSEDFVEVKRVHAVDITFYSADGVEIEPLLPISVVITVAEIESQQDAVVVHVDGDGAAEVVESQSEAPAGETELTVEMPATEQPAEAEDAGAESGEAPVIAGEEPVESLAFEADSFSVYAVVVTETIETKYIDDSGETWKISVGYGADAGIPAGATLAVEEVAGEDYLAQAQAALAGGTRVTLARFFDIKIMDGDAEVQPSAPVTVNIALDNSGVEALAGQDAHIIDGDDAAVCAVHFGEAPSVLPATETDEAVVFDAEGFSVWGVVYTVDFYYGNYEYHLNGEGSMTLSALFEALKIEADAAQAAEVVFTNPELLAVERLEDGSDWMLTSLEPFDTHELLTVTMTDKTVYEIQVEDETIVVNYNVNDPLAGWVYHVINHAGTFIYDSVAAIEDQEGQYQAKSTIKTRSAEEPSDATYTATPGYYFVAWFKNGTEYYGSTNDIRPIVTGTTWFTALFAPDNQYIVTYYSDEHGSVSSDRSYTADGKTIYYSYTGDTNGATAVPADQYELDGWYDKDNMGAGPISTDYTFDPSLVSGWHKNVIAKFKQAGTVTVTYTANCGKADKDNRGKVTITGGNNGSAYTQTETKYRGQKPSGATTQAVENRWTFLAWRYNNDTGEVITRDATLAIDTPVTEDTTYYADYIASSSSVVLFYSNGREYGKIEKIANSIEEVTGSTVKYNPLSDSDGFAFSNNITATAYDGYVFDHWEYNGIALSESEYSTNGNSANTIRKVYKPTNGTNIQELKAVFEPVSYITYDLGVIQQVGNNSPYYQHWEEVPWCSNDISIVGRTVEEIGTDLYIEAVNRHSPGIAPDLTSQTRVSQTNNGYNLLTHSFRGWRRSDNGKIVPVGANITDEQYGGDLPGSVTLTAVWDAYLPGKGKYNAWPDNSTNRDYRYNTNTCGFFVRLFDDVFDKGNTNTYTDCLFTTRIELKGEGVFAQPSGNGLRFDYVGNSDAYKLETITAIDSELRRLANTDQMYYNKRVERDENGVEINKQDHGVYCANTNIRLELDFPTDEFIFGRIRKWNESASEDRKIQIAGQKIPQVQINSNFFDIKWYVLKDQENSWHIDGMLIPKYAQLVVRKSFVGDADAIKNVLEKKGFFIGVDGDVDKAGTNDAEYKLKVIGTVTQNGYTNRVSIKADGSQATSEAESVGYFYKDADGQYVWVLNKLTPLKKYFAGEKNHTPNGDYTSSRRWTISNATAGTTRTSGSSYRTSDSGIVVNPYPDETPESALQTLNFTNSYAKKRQLTLVKRDQQTQNPLANVTLTFHMVKSGDATKQYTLIRRTDGNGVIAITLPTSDTLPDGTYSYTITEQAHEGYTVPEGNIAAGTVTLSESVGAQINVDSGYTLASAETDGSFLYIDNKPKQKNITVTKTWTNNAATPVNIQLLRNGVAWAGKNVTLGASAAAVAADSTHNTTAWTYTWSNLPAYADGAEIIYTVREEWIGLPGGETSVHYNTGADTDGYEEYIVTQSQKVDASGNVTVKIWNTPDGGQVSFSKVDEYKQAVAGAEFTVYKDESATTPITASYYAAGNVIQNTERPAVFSSNEDGIVTISGLNDGTYYVKETKQPDGYMLTDTRVFKLQVSGTSWKLTYTTNGGVEKALVSVENPTYSANVKVVKVITGTSTPLENAVFSLHGVLSNGEMDPTPIRGCEWMASGSDGAIFTKNLKKGVYYLVEEQAPAGYNILSGSVRLEVPSNDATSIIATCDGSGLTVTGDAQNGYTVNVPNSAGVALPNTGGSGTAAYSAAGSALVLLALALLLRKRRVG